jgi:hypothetical protein
LSANFTSFAPGLDPAACSICNQEMKLFIIHHCCCNNLIYKNQFHMFVGFCGCIHRGSEPQGKILKYDMWLEFQQALGQCPYS